VVRAPAPSFDLSTIIGQQGALAWLGYAVGDIDVVFGPQTKAGVIAFQRDHACAPDGVVGPQTKSTIAAALATV
jgi:peptidoglycan hydrolase-like protein with peptidoglycan-binding domain